MKAPGFSDCDLQSLFLYQQKRTNKGSTILRLAKLCMSAEREGNPIGAGEDWRSDSEPIHKRAIFFALIKAKKVKEPGFSDCDLQSLFLCQQKRTNKGSTILRLAKLCVSAEREGNPIFCFEKNIYSVKLPISCTVSTLRTIYTIVYAFFSKQKRQNFLFIVKRILLWNIL